ncbi:hypothetical protein BRC89_07075 [Halobacteriales archaeon QS_4_70_19]|nr:MAG: hypothetical protein BRC89_07075 [Halobacteriales archaeon QS_4_70_19]
MAATGDGPTAAPERDSFVRLLAFRLLVGFPLFGAGATLAEALGPVVPLSDLGFGLLFGTSVAAILWVLDVRSRLWLCFGFFLLQIVLGLTLVLPLSGLGVTVDGWAGVVVRGVSIVLAALLAFGVPWGRVRRRVERHLNPAAYETG